MSQRTGYSRAVYVGRTPCFQLVCSPGLIARFRAPSNLQFGITKLNFLFCLVGRGSALPNQPWPAAYVPAGLLSGKNPLLSFQTLTARVLGNITLDPWDIGGHYMRLALNQAGVLVVVALPLRSYATLQEASALNSTDWVKAWKSNAAAETALMGDLYAMQTCRSWDCPLRRRYVRFGLLSCFVLIYFVLDTFGPAQARNSDPIFPIQLAPTSCLAMSRIPLHYHSPCRQGCLAGNTLLLNVNH